MKRKVVGLKILNMDNWTCYTNTSCPPNDIRRRPQVQS